MRRLTLPLLAAALLVVHSSRAADTHWVADNGAAPSWAACESDTDPGGASSYCTLAQANTYADCSGAACDTVHLTTGTYGTTIAPSHSGSSSSNQLTFRSAPGAAPVVDVNGGMYGVLLDGVDYVKIEGLEIREADILVRITGGASYNEISNCEIHDSTGTANGGITIGTHGGVTEQTKNVHTWIHDNIIYRAGAADASCNDVSNLMKVGYSCPEPCDEDHLSGYVTVENNVMYHGGHHVIEFMGPPYNVVRNNVFHNEDWIAALPNDNCTYCTEEDDTHPFTAGLFGNRNGAVDDTHHSLFEGNRYGHAGLPSDGNGAVGTNCGGPNNIFRHNFFFANKGAGTYFRYGSRTEGDDGVLYNNTYFHNAFHPSCRANEFDETIVLHSSVTGVSIINNLIHSPGLASRQIWCRGGGGGVHNCDGQGHTIQGNFFHEDGDPGFVDPDISDPGSVTLPDLSLTATSPAIDGGMPLTAVASVTDTHTMVVDNAMFFQDGSWGSALSQVDADWICVGRVDNCVQLSSIDYQTSSVVTVGEHGASPSDEVWLYRNSVGRTVLAGDGPDQGADEYGAAGSGGAAGAGGQGGTGASAGAGGGPGEGGTGAAGAAAGQPVDETDGCGCRTRRRGRPGRAAGAWLLLGLLAVVRRRCPGRKRCAPCWSSKGGPQGPG